MNENFSKNFAEFKTKINDFLISTHFNSRLVQYEDMYNKTASVSTTDMKESIQNSPEFLHARQQSLDLMENIISLYKGLETIFNMDEETLGKFCQYDLNIIDQTVAKDLNEAASLLRQFDIASEKARKVIELIEDPFLSQGM